MSLSPKRILVIYCMPEAAEVVRQTILTHMRVLENSSAKHDIQYYNAHDDVPDWTTVDTSKPPQRPSHISDTYDAVILHYTLLSFRTTGLEFYKWKHPLSWINSIKAIKIALPLDEGSYHGTLDEWLYEMGVSIIFSVHHTEDRPLYPLMRNCASIYPCFPGYIDEPLARKLEPELQPISKRTIDICYRARKLPYFVGSAGQVKYQVGDAVQSRAAKYNLNCDISSRDEDVKLGNEWDSFLASSRTALGIEGGFSAIDWRGELQSCWQQMTRDDPNVTFEEFSSHCLPGWDDYRLLTITPRHFESISTKTCQILMEGEYKGVLQPDRHYISLKLDYSNLDEVLEKVQDHQYLQNMVDRAYDEILNSGKYTYQAFAHRIEQAIDHETNRPEGATVMSNTDSDQAAIAALQQELISQRQHNALLSQKVEEIQYKIPQVIQQSMNDFAESSMKVFIESSIASSFASSIEPSIQSSIQSSMKNKFIKVSLAIGAISMTSLILCLVILIVLLTNLE